VLAVVAEDDHGAIPDDDHRELSCSRWPGRQEVSPGPSPA
jgi:hypothetical protein